MIFHGGGRESGGGEKGEGRNGWRVGAERVPKIVTRVDKLYTPFHPT